MTEKRRAWICERREQVLLDLTNQAINSTASTTECSLLECEQKSSQQTQACFNSLEKLERQREEQMQQEVATVEQACMNHSKVLNCLKQVLLVNLKSSTSEDGRAKILDIQTI